MEKSTKKIMIETEQGRTFTIDTHEIIHNRALYYNERDEDTTYNEEYEYLCEDPSEITDWLFNNMDWYDCVTLLEVETSNKDLMDLEIADHHIFEPKDVES